MDLQTALTQFLNVVVTGFVTILLPVLLVYGFKIVKTFAETQFHKLSQAKQQQLSAYVQQAVVAVNNLVKNQQIANDLKAINDRIVLSVQAYADLHHIPVAVGQIEVEIQSAIALVFGSTTVSAEKLGDNVKG